MSTQTKPQFKVGEFYHWSRLGASKNQSIECDCFVTESNSLEITVFCLDDFSKQKLRTDSMACREELRQITKEKARKTLQDRLSRIQKEEDKIREKLQKMTELRIDISQILERLM